MNELRKAVEQALERERSTLTSEDREAGHETYLGERLLKILKAVDEEDVSLYNHHTQIELAVAEIDCDPLKKSFRKILIRNRNRKCPFDIECEDQYEDQPDLCGREDACPYRVYSPEGEEWGFEETLQKSPFWTLRGCQLKGRAEIDRTILRFIQNIAGDATEPNSGLYKNPDAMFNALDLIYWILEEAANGDLTVKKEDSATQRVLTWKLKKTTYTRKADKKGVIIKTGKEANISEDITASDAPPTPQPPDSKEGV